jgi:hypothetical protein
LFVKKTRETLTGAMALLERPKEKAVSGVPSDRLREEREVLLPASRQAESLNFDDNELLERLLLEEDARDGPPDDAIELTHQHTEAASSKQETPASTVAAQQPVTVAAVQQKATTMPIFSTVSVVLLHCLYRITRYACEPLSKST